MPTERFYHLQEEKKRVIYEAAFEEFSTIPYEKVSINQIIKKAGISRGSIYTYFEDKREILKWVFMDTVGRLIQTWEEISRENKGDMWKTAEQIMEVILGRADKQQVLQLARNIALFQDFDLSIRQQETLCGEEEHRKCLMERIYEKTDKSQFRTSDIHSFESLLSLIMASMMELLGRYCRRPENAENIKKLFRERLEILQYGICKK